MGHQPGWPAWTLTLENFRDYCEYTGYHLNTGRTFSSASLDRKDNRHGYHVWNLQILTLSANSSKGTKVEVISYAADGSVVIEELDELPF